ncbi:MAG: PEP-CTERM sorting domain-containing protein, partial [Verrucomicrobiota bacterium]|nr:PEP-CTERM sorting domain-containing protein [Verrucomicrobiota bacterium]
TGFAPGQFTVDTAGFGNLLGGGQFSVVQNGNDLQLVFAPIPEPGTWAMLLTGTALLTASMRRRRRS